jgi:hypothetical protein
MCELAGQCSCSLQPVSEAARPQVWRIDGELAEKLQIPAKLGACRPLRLNPRLGFGIQENAGEWPAYGHIVR